MRSMTGRPRQNQRAALLLSMLVVATISSFTSARSCRQLKSNHSFVRRQPAFAPGRESRLRHHRSRNERLPSQSDVFDDDEKFALAGARVRNIAAAEERRSFLNRSAGSLAVVIAAFAPSPPLAARAAAPAPTVAEVEAEATRSGANFDCLLDLPPLTDGCVRFYLCRHGQTENNRLHLVQGARVDPFLNDYGREQARRAGLAVGRLASSGAKERNGAVVPGVVVHSRMKRAIETAEVLTSAAVESSPRSSPMKLAGVVPSLGEVDFGILEGKDAGVVKAAMTGTFGAWATGGIDRRPPGGEGDSGREVLQRVAAGLQSLVDMAKASSSLSSSGGSVLAVTHSTYLRVLLATVGDEPLLQAAGWKIQNGSVNVVDIDVTGKTRKITISSKMFAGGLGAFSEEEKSFELVIPEAKVIRMNEARHMQGMTT